MDLGGFNWALLTIIGAAVLGAAMLIAMLRNRDSNEPEEKTERATRRLYDEEEAAHEGEDNRGP